VRDEVVVIVVCVLLVLLSCSLSIACICAGIYMVSSDMLCLAPASFVLAALFGFGGACGASWFVRGKR
jgi:hypothetical protein